MKTIAQNLVPNHSFEEADSLPCLFIAGNTGDPLLEDYVREWTTPTGGTSDIYSTTLPDSCFANPSCLGIQPRSGNNMTGIFTVEASGDYREYLQVKLRQPLAIGKRYYVEMYALRNADYPFAGNNLGIYFSKNRVDESKDYREVLDLSPQVLEEDIITEAQRWQRISGCFIADTNAEYLLIGNFFTTQETDTAFLDPQGQPSAYYFIDDVYVEELVGLPENILGNDTLLCAGETLLLDAFVEGATYQWLGFATEPTFLVEGEGTYFVDITLGYCTFSDTITITYEPSLSLGKDTLLCYGETLVLDASHINNQYRWSDGSTASTLEVKESGTYWITIPSQACSINDTINVSFTECPGIISNVFTPGNDNVNETFHIANIENRQWQLRIFNRWGKEVYASDNYQNDWTGAGLAAGVYFYHLRSSTLQREYKGWVHLLRRQAF